MKINKKFKTYLTDTETIVIILIFIILILIPQILLYIFLRVDLNNDYKRFLLDTVVNQTIIHKENIVCEQNTNNKASYYDYDLNVVGQKCVYDKKIKGECYSQNNLTAASRDFPRGSSVLVTDLATGKNVVVKINDFGPDKEIHPDRIIDLSSKAFIELVGSTKIGIISVKVEKIN